MKASCRNLQGCLIGVLVTASLLSSQVPVGVAAVPFHGGTTVIYTLTDNNDLMWYRMMAVAMEASYGPAPEVSVPALMHMREEFGARIYKRYGFVDAFHPANGWTDRDVIGIDVGITLLSAENLRFGKVWTWFTRNRQIRRAMSELFT